MMNMLQKTVMAAVACGALLTAVAQPAEAFTLSASAPAAAVAGSDVQHVYYYYRYGYRPYYHRFYRPYAFVRPWGYRCWINRWGARVCG